MLVKRVVGIASARWESRAMHKWFVTVSNILKVVDLILFKEQSRSNRVNRSVTPSLVKESTFAIQIFKERLIFWTAEKVQVANLKVAPEMTAIVGKTVIIGYPVQVIVLWYHFLVLFDEFLDSVPERLDGDFILVKRDCEACVYKRVLLWNQSYTHCTFCCPAA